MKDRRDQRTQILQDLEIAEKLPEGSRAREILTIYAGNRAVLIPIENHVRHIGWNEGVDFVLFIAVMAIGVSTAGGDYWRYLLAFGSALAIVVLRMRTYRRRIGNLIDQYLREQDLPATTVDSIQALVLRSYSPWRVWGIFLRRRAD